MSAETRPTRTQAVRLENGRIAIFKGTSCSEGYCREYGCAFPDCATFTGEEFDTEEQAVATYPGLEVVG